MGKGTRVLARIGVVVSALFLASFGCAVVTGHFTPLEAVEVIINIAVLSASLWILNQPA